MDLREFSSGPKAAKQWLNIIANNITASTVTADNIIGPVSADEIVLVEQSSVSNPPVGSTAIYVNNSGVITTQGSSGPSVPYLPVTGGQMVGDIDMNANSLLHVLTLSGSTNTRTGDNIVSNAGVSVVNDLAVFSDSSGKIIEDSGVLLSSLVPYSGSAPVLGDIAIFNGTGNEIEDSGIQLLSLVEEVSINKSNVTGLLSQTSTIAPRGLSDIWSNPNPSTAPGSLIINAPQIPIMIGSDNTVGIRYSTDNGINWSNATGTSANLYTVGWSGSLFAAVSTSGSPQSLYSSNGTSWTVGNPPPTLPANDVVTIGYYFSQFMVASTTGVMTSPDGINWTAQTSSRTPYTFASNGIVVVGASPQGFLYSPDGTTWTNTVDTFNCRGICFSSERNEFIAVSANSASTYRSVDGINWTQHTNNIPSSIVQRIIWIDSYSRYYITARDPVTLLYSLWTSVDGITPFINNPHMNGATASGTNFYSLFYNQSLDSIYIISNNTPNVHISSNSNNTVSLGNFYTSSNVLIQNGLPAIGRQFIMTINGPVYTNSTVETSLLGTGLGSLTIPKLPIGMHLRFKFVITAPLSSGVPTLTLNFKINNNVVASMNGITYTAGQGDRYDLEFTGLSDGTSINWYFGKFTTGILNTGNYVVPSGTSLPQTFDFTGTWSSATLIDSIQLVQCFIDAGY